MRIRGVWGWLAGAVVLLAACDGDLSHEDPAGPAYPDLGAFCAGLGRAACDGEVWQDCSATSADACAAHQQLLCLSRYSATKTYVPAQGEACVNAHRAVYADARVTQAERATLEAACETVVEGSGTDGSPCSADLDCKTSAGLRCIAGTAGEATEGSCRLPRAIAKGDRCDAPDSVCAAGTYCAAASSGRFCLAASAAGESCGAGVPCTPELACYGGTCRDRYDDGHACDVDGDCKGGFCSASAHVCGHQIVLSPAEPACADLR
jgi:hypothetical protein